MNILWDFDGTLFDTYPAYTKVFSAVLGDKADPTEIYNKLKVSSAHAMEYFHLTDDQIKEIDRLEDNISPKDMIPFEHVEDILKFANKNVIMTHKSRAGVLAILQHYGWEKYFIDMVTYDDGFPRKPDPASYHYLHTKHKIDLVIGDRELDIIPGKALGISTCLYRNPSNIADYHLQDYADFFKIFNINGA